jgi:hypothetical protein
MRARASGRDAYANPSSRSARGFTYRRLWRRLGNAHRASAMTTATAPICRAGGTALRIEGSLQWVGRLCQRNHPHERETCRGRAICSRYRIWPVTRHLRKTLPLLAVGIALGSCGGPGPAKSLEPAPTRTTAAISPVTAQATTTTTAVSPSEPTCETAQLGIQYTGSQGATGFWTAGFWIADRSQTPCALRSSVTVDLIDRYGSERSASAPLRASIPLSAGATLPSTSGANPPAGEQLGSLVLAWPTLPNAIDELGGSDGPNALCPQPLFIPVVARVTFSGSGPVTVPQLSIAGPIPSSVGSICGNFVRIVELDSLT